MNTAKLHYEMERKGITTKEMAQRIGISRSAFWKKCNGISEFRQSEIQKIVEVLEIKDPAEIFFCREVS